jgi:geranylgeranyl pyrophosphate synthase
LTASGGAQQVLAYVRESQGKGLRPALVLLAYELCGGELTEPALDAAAGAELVHMASLIHDDVVDDGEVRRGRPALHRKFGRQIAVLTGDHLFAAAFHLFNLVPDSAVARLMTEVIQDMCLGEIGQLISPAVNEEGYYNYIYCKTARLIGGCCRLGAMLAGQDAMCGAELQTVGESIGLAYQLTDDVLDYRGEAAVMGKQVGRDFAEGIWTLPIIRAYARRLLPINWADRDFREVQGILEHYGLLSEVWQQAEEHLARAMSILELFPWSSARQKLLDLCQRISQRQA